MFEDWLTAMNHLIWLSNDCLTEVFRQVLISHRNLQSLMKQHLPYILPLSVKAPMLWNWTFMSKWMTTALAATGLESRRLAVRLFFHHQQIPSQSWTLFFPLACSVTSKVDVWSRPYLCYFQLHYSKCCLLLFSQRFYNLCNSAYFRI